MSSWVTISEDSQFSLQNLPYGVFSRAGQPGTRLGVAVGDLEARMARLCWACGREAEDPSSLKTCTECRVAKYCDRWTYRVLQLDTGCSVFYLQGLSEAGVEGSQVASQRTGAHKKYLRICEVARQQQLFA